MVPESVPRTMASTSRRVSDFCIGKSPFQRGLRCAETRNFERRNRWSRWCCGACHTEALNSLHCCIHREFCQHIDSYITGKCLKGCPCRRQHKNCLFLARFAVIGIERASRRRNVALSLQRIVFESTDGAADARLPLLEET